MTADRLYGPDRLSLFIVGVGRSGTSLLQSMLAAHSAVAVPPETAFLRRYASGSVLSRCARDAGMDQVVAVLEQDPLVAGTGVSAKAIVAAAASDRQLCDIAVYQAMLQAVARAQNKCVVADKDPRAIEFLPLVKAALPWAHVVHIIRDPRDVLLSKTKAAWSRRHGILHHLFANRVQLRLGRRQGPRVFGDRYHELFYEDLIADPESELRRLCERVGIPYEPTMLDYDESARHLVTDRELCWKKETLGPLLRHNRGKWASELSARDIALTESICADHFRLGRYRRVGVAAHSVRSRLLVAAATLGLTLMDPLYRAYRRWRRRVGGA